MPSLGCKKGKDSIRWCHLPTLSYAHCLAPEWHIWINEWFLGTTTGSRNKWLWVLGFESRTAHNTKHTLNHWTPLWGPSKAFLQQSVHPWFLLHYSYFSLSLHQPVGEKFPWKQFFTLFSYIWRLWHLKRLLLNWKNTLIS